MRRQGYHRYRKKIRWEFPGGLVVKDDLWSLLWRRFDPCPRNFRMLWAEPKRKERKKCFKLFQTEVPAMESESWARDVGRGWGMHSGL